MYQFRITLNDDDYLEYNKVHLTEHPAGKRALLVYRLIGPIIFVLCIPVFIFFFEELYLRIIVASLLGVGAVVWPFISKSMIVSSTKSNIKKMKKHGKLPYSKESTLRFEDDCFVEITEMTESKTSYSMIERIVLGKNAVYVYVGAMQAQIIPNYVFVPESVKDEFLAFLNSKISGYRNAGGEPPRT